MPVYNKKEGAMGLINWSDVTPLAETDDSVFGYLAGQRTCRSNAFLTRQAVSLAAHQCWLRSTHVVLLNRNQYVDGFRRGYVDELNGLAQPLPFLRERERERKRQ